MINTDTGSMQKRRYRREDIQLEVLVKLGAHNVCRTRTANVSEGGIALDGMAGMEIAPGNVVDVKLWGVISDKSQRRHSGYSMRVVHSSAATTGLEFI